MSHFLFGFCSCFICTGSYENQVGFELYTLRLTFTSNLPASLSAEIIGLCHHAGLTSLFKKKKTTKNTKSGLECILVGRMLA